LIHSGTCKRFHLKLPPPLCCQLAAWDSIGSGRSQDASGPVVKYLPSELEHFRTTREQQFASSLMMLNSSIFGYPSSAARPLCPAGPPQNVPFETIGELQIVESSGFQGILKERHRPLHVSWATTIAIATSHAQLGKQMIPNLIP
jgi:hypothetical protein